MKRRDALKSGAAGITGLVLSTILPEQEANALETIEYAGHTNRGGVDIWCYKPNQVSFPESNKFWRTVGRNKLTNVHQGTTEPTVEFSYLDNKTRVRIGPQGDNALKVQFPAYSLNGVFNGKSDVIIEVEDGIVEVARENGWKMPVISFIDAKGSIYSGSNLVHANYAQPLDFKDMSKVENFGFRGSTPLAVRTNNQNWEYQFLSQGGAKTVRYK